jgi:hypothetical protein
METIVRQVRDIDSNERRMLERVIGRELEENQCVVIQVVTPVNPSLNDPEKRAESQPGKLPEWCNVYEGLTNEQVEDIERVILDRSDFARPVERSSVDRHH